MTIKDINDIIKTVCPNDEDYEKPCISPKYLRQELEQLALDQRQWNGEPTTKNKAKYCDRNICLRNEYNNVGCEDCEVTKSQEPTTKNNSSGLEKNSKKLEKDFGKLDCISRAYLLDDSKYHTVFNDDTGNFEDVVYREDIEKAPSVTPQKPKIGHWINKSQRSGCGILFIASECTCCGKKTPFNCDEFLYRYCPNCGADMREVEE